MNMTGTFKGKACGKFILMGEHFVIEKVPALAFPLLNLQCEVKVTPNHHPHYLADLPDNVDKEAVSSLMARATYAAANSLRLDIAGQPLRVESVANFPISRGFGSSASFAVALVRALDSYRKKMIGENADWNELTKATSAVENIFHGRPSGVDAAVILAGRPIRFEDGNVVRELRNNAVDFVTVDSGSREHCAALVSEVINFRERNKSQWDKMALALHDMVDECENALAAGKAQIVAAAVSGAHGILSELGLSHAGIDQLIDQALGLGALAGKVSGAGGGGAVLLVANKGDGVALAKRLKEFGRNVIGVDTAQGAMIV